MPRILSTKVILYVLFLHILDLSFGPVLQIGSTRPIFLYLMIVYAAFKWGGRKTLVMGAIAGFLRDLTGTHPLGIELGILLVSSLVLEILVRKIERQWWAVQAATSFIYVFASLVLVLTASQFFGVRTPVTGFNLGIAFSTALYTSAITPAFFYVTMRWFRDRLPLKQYELFK